MEGIEEVAGSIPGDTIDGSASANAPQLLLAHRPEVAAVVAVGAAAAVADQLAGLEHPAAAPDRDAE